MQVEVETDGAQVRIDPLPQMPVTVLPRERTLAGIEVTYLHYPLDGPSVMLREQRVVRHESLEVLPVLRVVMRDEPDVRGRGLRLADDIPVDVHVDAPLGFERVGVVPHPAAEVLRDGLGTSLRELGIGAVCPFRGAAGRDDYGVQVKGFVAEKLPEVSPDTPYLRGVVPQVQVDVGLAYGELHPAGRVRLDPPLDDLL